MCSGISVRSKSGEILLTQACVKLTSPALAAEVEIARLACVKVYLESDSKFRCKNLERCKKIPSCPLKGL